MANNVDSFLLDLQSRLEHMRQQQRLNRMSPDKELDEEIRDTEHQLAMLRSVKTSRGTSQFVSALRLYNSKYSPEFKASDFKLEEPEWTTNSR